VAENQLFIGIDVSKAKLDAALRPGNESFSVSSNPRGIAVLIKQFKKLSVSRIVLEGSGGYEIAAASEVAAAGLPVAVVDPRQVRDFARATGRLAREPGASECETRKMRRRYSFDRSKLDTDGFAAGSDVPRWGAADPQNWRYRKKDRGFLVAQGVLNDSANGRHGRISDGREVARFINPGE